MPIENRNLTAGTRLEAKYKKQTYTCQVMEAEDGKLRYRLGDGREFKSPSAAGSAITGHACDGWVFWSVQMTKRASEPAEPVDLKQEPAADPEPTPQAETIENTSTETGEDKKNVCRRVANQKGVPEGQVRWHCYACRMTFMLPTGQTPKGCPGHPTS